MLLVVDIGNTNITLGVFEENNLIKTFRLNSDKNLSQNEYQALLKNLLKDYQISDCIIGSVVKELSDILKKACDKIFEIDSFLFTTSDNCGLNIKLNNPNTLGIDRIANAIAAKQYYPLPIIVVDIGTATTFDIISDDGDFIGGIIMPGLNLQFDSLNSKTSKLPKITICDSKKAIGDSTKSALLSGVIRGSACAIEGLLKQCEIELGKKATIIATGGHCEIISQYMQRSFDYINKDLTLDGLRILYNINKSSII